MTGAFLFSSFNVSRTRPVISPPNPTIIPNAPLSPAACATDPTSGGTIKNPRYPTVDTDAIADPLLIPTERPAMLKTIGITQDTPKPVRIKPTPAAGA